MNYALKEITPLIKEWTTNVRLPDVVQEMSRRYYYKAVAEQSIESQQAEKEKCRLDPVHWFNHWVWTYDPRGMSMGLPANLPFVLRPKQIELIEWLQDREGTQTSGLVEKSRDEGMSYVILGFFLHHWLFVEGFAAGVGSRKEELVDKKGDPKTLFHKFRDMLSKLPDWMKPEGFNRREHDNYMRIVNPANGATLTGEAGDNIGRGGRTSMYLLDEWAFVANPEEVDAAISQNTNVVIKGSTPNGIGNRFYQDRFSGRYPIFTMPWRDNPDKNWTVEYKGKQIHPWYEKQLATLDDVVLAQEVDIDYAASVVGVIILKKWVLAAIDAHIKLGFEPVGRKRIGFDVADDGADKCATAEAHGSVLLQVDEWKADEDELLKSCTKVYNKAIDSESEINYDCIGVGASAGAKFSELNQLHKTRVAYHKFNAAGAVLDPDKMYGKTKRKNKDMFYNLKAQSWWLFADRLKNTYNAVTNNEKFNSDEMVSISSKCHQLHQVIDELCTPMRDMATDGRVKVESKKDLAKRGVPSPNRADAIVMAFAPTPKVLKVSNKVLSQI